MKKRVSVTPPNSKEMLHRRTLATWCVLAVGVLLSTSSFGMDLRQAYEAANANDATIRASRSGAEATKERLPQAKAQLLPNVSLNAARNYNDLTSKTTNILGASHLN